MAEFDLDELLLEDIIDKSLLSGTELLHSEIRKITPRDKERLPKSIDMKNENRVNKHFHYRVVKIGGKWYEGVTGNLKRSIGIEKLGVGEYVIGVKKGPTEEYAGRQEFGGRDSRGVEVPERSYLRKGLGDYEKIAINRVREVFNSLINN